MGASSFLLIQMETSSRIPVLSYSRGSLGRWKRISGYATQLIIKIVLRLTPQLFWSCGNRMIHARLSNANRPDGHYIRPRSLEVTSISAIMSGVVKATANLSKLAAQGNYPSIRLNIWRKSILAIRRKSRFPYQNSRLPNMQRVEMSRPPEILRAG